MTDSTLIKQLEEASGSELKQYTFDDLPGNDACGYSVDETGDIIGLNLAGFDL